MASSLPLVSVIVPAHNAEQTLPETLNSALASTYRDIDVIVVDDASTDRTAAIAEQFAGSDDRVRVHRRPQGGVSAALNSGLALAQGEFVARLDADDVWHPTKIEKQVEFAVRNADIAFVYTFVRYIDRDGRVLSDGPPQRFPRRALCRGIYESLVGANSSALMRRSAVQEVGGYDETLASWEDLLLQLKISARHPIGFVPEYLVGYRVRPGSLSADPDNMLRSWRQVRAQIAHSFAQTPLFVHRWAHGRRCVELAESFAWRGRYASCASLLVEGMSHDPVRTTRLLQSRLARRLRGQRSAPPEPDRRPPFLDCSPDEQVASDPSVSDSNSVWRLDVRRASLLDRLDAIP
jgi:glycosyltransferase involved in cell wall biosynthesis